MTFSLHLLFATIVFLAAVERIPALRRRRSSLLRRHMLTDLAFFGLSWLALAPLALWWVRWATGAAHGALGLPSIRTPPLWLETLLALVLLDAGNYLAHWVMHRYAPLWRVHAVHHSIPMLDWLATFRSHPLEQLLRRLFAPLLLVLLGISPATVAIASGIFIAWGIVNHANVRVSPRILEPLFITPRLHLLHHVPASAQRNLGTLLSVWDRLTGRFVSVDVAADTALGTGDRQDPQTFAALLMHPFVP
jgi:sterol desaturase/sphingolipid hydroxylase (fatty acid hydroxylase superfamily)